MAGSYTHKGSCVCGYAYSGTQPGSYLILGGVTILRNSLYFICDMSKRNTELYICGATLSSACVNGTLFLI